MATKLTAKAVEAAKPGTSRKEIGDAIVPGLYLVVQPSGAKSWAIRYRHAGKPKKLVLGTVAPKLEGQEPTPMLDTPLSLNGARTLAREQMQLIAAGEDPAASKIRMKRDRRDTVKIEADLFENVARQFIERYAKPKNRSWAETARLLGLHPDPEGEEPAEKRALVVKGGVASEWQGRRVQDITRRDIIDLLDGIVDRGAPVVAVRTLAAIRKFFGWAAERGVIEASPAAGVKPPAAVKSRDRVLDDDELARVWRAASRQDWPFGPLTQLLILTGARREEIGALAWRELKGDHIALAGTRTKNGEARTIPLSAPAQAVVATLPKAGKSYVFTTTGSSTVSGWSRAKRTLDREAGQVAADGARLATPAPLPDWRIHDLRRTVATGLQRLGFRLEVIEATLGHISGSRSGVVGVYQRHAFEAEKREAFDAWGRYVKLIARPLIWSRLRDHLSANDVPKGEQNSTRRTREREFTHIITTGGSAWTSYVRSVLRPIEAAENVVALHA